MNATEITRFFLSHRGRCFEGWSEEKIFSYVLVNCVHGNVFVARTQKKSGQKSTSALPEIGLVAIAWPGDAGRIKDTDARGLAQFSWEHPKGGSATCDRTPSGDSILIADVAGDRSLMPEILKQVSATLANAPRAIFQKRLFTYRRGGSATGLRLVELSWETVMRFSRLRIADCGLRNIPHSNDQHTIGDYSEFRDRHSTF